MATASGQVTNACSLHVDAHQPVGDHRPDGCRRLRTPEPTFVTRVGPPTRDRRQAPDILRQRWAWCVSWSTRSASRRSDARGTKPTHHRHIVEQAATAVTRWSCNRRPRHVPAVKDPLIKVSTTAAASRLSFYDEAGIRNDVSTPRTTSSRALRGDRPNNLPGVRGGEKTARSSSNLAVSTASSSSRRPDAEAAVELPSTSGGR